MADIDIDHPRIADGDLSARELGTQVDE